MDSNEARDRRKAIERRKSGKNTDDVTARRVALESRPSASEHQKVEAVKSLVALALKNGHDEKVLRETLQACLGEDWKIYSILARGSAKTEGTEE